MLKDAEALKDYFGDNYGSWHAWCHTLTRLRVPKDYVNETYKIGSEIPVQVIDEMDRHGLWKKIRQTTKHTKPFALHAWLTEDLKISKDPISGYYDVAVGRGGYWPHDERCLLVDALYGRWGADSGVGFRPVVRGSV